MTITGLEVFDSTVHKTNSWLVARAVFYLLSHRVTRGEIEDLRSLWP